MKKKILLIFMILFLTGCTAKYETKIYLGGSVEEKGKVYINSTLLGKGNYSQNKDEFLSQVAKEFGFSQMRRKRNFQDSNYVGYSFYGKYNNFQLFLSESNAIGKLYQNKSAFVKEGVVDFNLASDRLAEYHNPTGDISTYVDNIEITISLPYKVLSNNATKVDYDNNKYTWIISPQKVDNSIKIKYDENKLFTNNPAYLMSYVKWYIYVFSILAIITIFIVISFARRVVAVERIEKN